MLSGGGARGAAHIGVLKVLEENRIPVHAIAGSSMGAVVGGLYASGLSPADIERVMNTVDWQDAFRDRPPRTDLDFRRKLEDRNFLVKFPLGLKGRQFPAAARPGAGTKAHADPAPLTLPVAQVQRFDDLAIPFRAIATDIVTGERVVIERGDLTTAMRASLSAPGVFVPVESEGRLLVDGGLSSNLPVDVAREHGRRHAHRGRLWFSAARARQAGLGGHRVQPDARDPDPAEHEPAAQDSHRRRHSDRPDARRLLVPRLQ